MNDPRDNSPADDAAAATAMGPCSSIDMETADMETASRDRSRCYDCFRPREACVCGGLPRIENRTELLLVQHRREQFHPFNTARLVRKSLVRATLIADQTRHLAQRIADCGRLSPGAGLLFPGDEALALETLPSDQHPRQLVVVDGTWHQAKTLVRDLPVLRDLPRYRLSPTAPSRFKIRREPNAEALSTVEAVVAALRVLEPETVGFDQLLEVFYRMVDRQDEHPKLAANRRVLAKRGRTLRNIPLALIDHPERIVVAYGEQTAGGRGTDARARQPLVWVAQRLETNECFRCVLAPVTELNDAQLSHLEMTRDGFRDAVSLDEARRAWASFLRPTDLVAVYHPGVMRLLSMMGSERQAHIVLKSIDFDPTRQPGTLEQWIASARLAMEPILFPGRAGRRLACAATLARYLREQALTYRAAYAEND